MRSVAIYIDGSNFYHYLKGAGFANGEVFNFKKFVERAVENIYDVAIVVSSDTDLIPAVRYVQEIKRKRIEYVGFEHAPSFGLKRWVDASLLLTHSDIDALKE